jgi:hypothetical protein
VVSPQQVHRLAINYMTHPIHGTGAVCFHWRGVRRQCSAYDGASTSIGAARPHQSTPLSGRCRAEIELFRPARSSAAFALNATITDLDAVPQISLFRKLKLTKCARNAACRVG